MSTALARRRGSGGRRSPEVRATLVPVDREDEITGFRAIGTKLRGGDALSVQRTAKNHRPPLDARGHFAALAIEPNLLRLQQGTKNAVLGRREIDDAPSLRRAGHMAFTNIVGPGGQTVGDPSVRDRTRLPRFGQCGERVRLRIDRRARASSHSGDEEHAPHAAARARDSTAVGGSGRRRAGHSAILRYRSPQLPFPLATDAGDATTTHSA
jgi:hypothetical protein